MNYESGFRWYIHLKYFHETTKSTENQQYLILSSRKAIHT
jgi:hypothetical protein